MKRRHNPPMPLSLSPDLTARLWLAGSMALVGGYVGVSPWLLAVFPVALLAWLRFCLAAVPMLPWSLAGQQPPLDRRSQALLFLQSLLGNVLFTWCALTGTQLTSALSAGVVMAGIPAAVAVLSWVFLRERLSARVVLAVLLTAVGVGLLAWARHGPGAAAAAEAAEAAGAAAGAGLAPAWWSTLWGHALLLAAVLCEASYVVIGKALSLTVSPRRVTAVMNLWGLALTTPLGLWAALSFPFAEVGLGSWALLLFYALSASVLTVWMWMKGLQRVPAPQAGVFTVCLPLSAAAVAVFLLGEPATAWHALALGLAVLAVLLVTVPGSGPAGSPPPTRPPQSRPHPPT